jgi:hypothetical protein
MHNKAFTRIENEPNLRKDASSGAVVNVSTDDYNKYMKRKQMARRENERLDHLETELREVKGLLRSVVDRLTVND